MKQSKKIYAFKNELRNYRQYHVEIKETTELIEYYYGVLSGVRAIDTSREPVHSPPNKDFEYRVRDEIELQNKKLELLKNKVNYINEILEKIGDSDNKPIISVYIDGETIEKVSRQHYLSHNALLKRMNKSIERALR